MAEKITFTILGNAHSKANSRMVREVRGRLHSFRSPEAQEFANGALPQIPMAARQQLTCPVRFTAHFYYQNTQSDLDESIVLDVLQTQKKTVQKKRYVIQRGVYENDNQVKEKHVYWHHDPDNPRIEIEIEPLDAVQGTMDLGSPMQPKYVRPPDRYADPDQNLSATELLAKGNRLLQGFTVKEDPFA